MSLVFENDARQVNAIGRAKNDAACLIIIRLEPRSVKGAESCGLEKTKVGRL
jgi:hypothetical protein